MRRFYHTVILTLVALVLSAHFSPLPAETIAEKATRWLDSLSVSQAAVTTYHDAIIEGHEEEENLRKQQEELAENLDAASVQDLKDLEAAGNVKLGDLAVTPRVLVLFNQRNYRLAKGFPIRTTGKSLPKTKETTGTLIGDGAAVLWRLSEMNVTHLVDANNGPFTRVQVTFILADGTKGVPPEFVEDPILAPFVKKDGKFPGLFMELDVDDPVAAAAPVPATPAPKAKGSK